MRDFRDVIVRWGRVEWLGDDLSCDWLIRDFHLDGTRSSQPIIVPDDLIILLEIQWDAEEVGMEPLEWLNYCDGHYISTPYREP